MLSYLNPYSHVGTLVVVAFSVSVWVLEGFKGRRRESGLRPRKSPMSPPKVGFRTGDWVERGGSY